MAAAASADGASGELLTDSPGDSPLVRKLRAALRAERTARLDAQLVAEQSLQEQARVSAAACSVLSSAAAKVRSQFEGLAGGAPGPAAAAARLPELERMHLLALVEAETQRAESFRVRLQ